MRPKLYTKITAILLAIVMALLLPVQSGAQTAAQEQTGTAVSETVSETEGETEFGVTAENNVEEDEPYSQPMIISEDTEKRDGYTKHFLTEDGSYIAAQYNYPIHFQDESGEWVEYDNSLIEQTAEADEDIPEDEELSISESTAENPEIFETAQTEPTKTESGVTELPESSDESTAESDSEPESRLNEEIAESETKNTEVSENLTQTDPLEEISETPATEFKNKSSNIDVRFSKFSKKNNMVKLKLGSNKVSWGFKDIQKSKAEISLNNEALEGDDRYLVNTKMFGEAVYSEAFKNVDLQYIVMPVGVKENIILKNKDARTDFTIEYKFNNLTAVQADEKTVELRNKRGECVYIISAPYMTDSKGKSSTEVSLKIDSFKNSKLTLTLSADKEWIEESGREFPVVIDPSFETGQEWQKVQCTYVDSDNPNTAYGYGSAAGNVGNVYMGYYGSGNYRTYLKMNELPVLKSDDMLIAAKVNFAPNNTGFFYSMPIYAYEVLGDWQQSTLTWNNQPSHSSTAVDYMTVYNGQPSNTWKQWDITSLAKKWYTGGNNYGVVFMPDESTSNQAAGFYSSNYPSVLEVRPIIQIAYRNAAGLEGYMTYTTESAGIDGSISVNNYNGNVVAVQNLGGMNGLRMPISLALTYNQSQAGQAGFCNVGRGWKINVSYFQIETNSKIKDNYPYYFIDQDGTRHHFFKDSDGKYKDEDGLGYTLTKTTNPYEIEDKSGNKMIFNGSGFQTSVQDANSNSINITYSSGKKITQMTDGAGRKYVFTNDASNNLTSITFPDNKKCTLQYTAQGGYTNLTKITYPDGTYTTLTYDGIYLASIKRSTDTYYAKCSYNTKSSRATALCTYNAGKLKSQVDFDYSRVNVTKLTDRKISDGVLQSGNYGVYEYQFDNYGHTVGAVNKTTGQAQYYEYGAPGVAGTSGLKGTENKLLSESRTLQYVNNLAENVQFTGTLGYTVSLTTPSTAGIYTGYGHSDSSCLKIMRTESSTDTVSVYKSKSGLPAGEYTFSAYFSTNAGTLTGNGAYLEVIRFNSGTNQGSARSSSVAYTDANEWVRRSVTIKVNSGESLSYRIVLPSGSSGTVYADDVQLEKGMSANRFNMAENSSFANSSTGWTGGTKTAVSGNPMGLTSAVRLLGDPTEDVSSYRAFSVSGAKGDVFTYGAWLKGSSVPVGEKKHGSDGITTARLRIEFYNGGTLVSSGSSNHTIDMNCGVSDWQYLNAKAIAPGTYNSVRLYFDYGYNANSAYMTGVYLSKDPFGQTYTYDKNGNIVSSQDLAKTNASFAYQNNMLSKMVNPSGSQYMYAYDSKNNLTYAASSEGQTYKFEYDSAGNPTKSALYADTNRPVSSVTSGKYYVIRCVADGGVINSKPNTNLSPVFTQNYNPEDKGQVWYLTSYDTGFRLRSCQNTGYSLDLKGGGTTDGTKIQVATSSASNTNQKFTLTAHSGDAYGTSFIIKTKTSGKCVTAYADAGSRAEGIKTLEQRAVNNYSQWQRWYFYEVPNPENGTQETGKKKIVSSAEYVHNQNYLSSVKDTFGNVTQYNYDGQVNSDGTGSTGRLLSVTDPKNTVTSYTYNDSEQVTSVSASDSTVNYTYDSASKRLTQIAHNGGNVKYGISYDALGRRSALTLNASTPRTLASYTYDGRDNLTQMEYGNGGTVDYTYDNLDRVTKKSYNGSNIGESYYYDAEGNLALVDDGVNNTRTRYEYDMAGRLSSYTKREGASADSGSLLAGVEYRYENGKDRLTENRVTLPQRGSTSTTVTNKTNYVYGSGAEEKDRITQVKENGTTRLSYTYDSLGRRTQTKVSMGSKDLTSDYFYSEGEADDTTSTRVRSVHLGYWENSSKAVDRYDFYFYDENGNITTRSEDTSTYVYYTYDNLNQLTREDDPVSNTTTVYTYDNGGNIQSKKVYDFTREQSPANPKSTVTYKYDGSWKDLLTTYNGQSITYDTIGNPLKYRDSMNFTWQNGRQLATAKKGSTTTLYSYDMDGLRQKKTVGSAATTYYYAGTTLLGEYNASTGRQLIYLYDESGGMYGFTQKTASATSNYYFVKNLQGDVIGLLNSNGILVANYRYNAWGKLLSVTNASGADIISPTHIANINPIRYRGYYYDTETGFYYLQSRYYDPEMGRFINADTTDILKPKDDLYDKNLFAYCDNNPVVRLDRNGQFWDTVFDVISLGASIVEVCVNPTDPWAWAGLAGDAIDLIPFVTGVGEVTRAVKTTVDVVDKATDVVDTAKTIYKTADAASDIRKATGSYEILYKSGKNYIGKGGFNRAITSAIRNAKKYRDEVTSIMWKSAPNSRSAFIDEYLMQRRFGGVLSSNIKLPTYNKIWSPGRRYFGG